MSQRTIPGAWSAIIRNGGRKVVGLQFQSAWVVGGGEEKPPPSILAKVKTSPVDRWTQVGVRDPRVR